MKKLLIILSFLVVPVISSHAQQVQQRDTICVDVVALNNLLDRYESLVRIDSMKTVLLQYYRYKVSLDSAIISELNKQVMSYQFIIQSKDRQLSSYRTLYYKEKPKKYYWGAGGMFIGTVTGMVIATILVLY